MQAWGVSVSWIWVKGHQAVGSPCLRVCRPPDRTPRGSVPVGVSPFSCSTLSFSSLKNTPPSHKHLHTAGRGPQTSGAAWSAGFPDTLLDSQLHIWIRCVQLTGSCRAEHAGKPAGMRLRVPTPGSPPPGPRPRRDSKSNVPFVQQMSPKPHLQTSLTSYT